MDGFLGKRIAELLDHPVSDRIRGYVEVEELSGSLQLLIEPFMLGVWPITRTTFRRLQSRLTTFYLCSVSPHCD